MRIATTACSPHPASGNASMAAGDILLHLEPSGRVSSEENALALARVLGGACIPAKSSCLVSSCATLSNLGEANVPPEGELETGGEGTRRLPMVN
eukprot:scaffold256111_cov33-Tisochrysis_lutea.AAC.5